MFVKRLTPPNPRLSAFSKIVWRSAVDILAEAPGHRLFKTVAEVDDYLRKERDAWDR